VVLSLAAPAAFAAPTLRVQVDQRGDLALIGNTLAQDCSLGTPAPLTGTVGACGFRRTSDSAPDVFWASNDGAGTAAANTGVALASSQSTAVLSLPAGATVTHAYLYWAGESTGLAAAVDNQVTFGRPGASAVTVDAIRSATATWDGSDRYYQAVGDVTSLVQTLESGTYRVGGVATVNVNDRDDEVTFAAWSLVVFYEDPAAPPRNLALFDGLDRVSPGNEANATLAGFRVPNAGFDAKLGVIAYEGDGQISGDSLRFGTGTLGAGNNLSDALNPATDFFNSTRSLLGVSATRAGDLPRLTGGSRSMGGFDLDVVDITSRVTAGQTSANIQATTSGDVYFLGAFATSISTFKPDFTASEKSVRDENGGALAPGDVLEYTIDVVNTGNDASSNTVLTDALPPQVTYVPGSLQILAGPGVGALTDGVDADRGEVVGGVVTVRLGTGATSTLGGALPVGGTTTLRLRVTVNADASGVISNQALITAGGQRGAPPETVPTDGNGGDPGAPPTDTTVVGCLSDTDCSVLTPRCDVGPDPNRCVGCLGAADCGGTTPVCNAGTQICEACDADADCGGQTPACQPSGACGECSPSNTSACGGATPVCNTTSGTCVGCNSSADCSGATPVCNAGTRVCEACDADADCGGQTPACQPSGACGECSPSNTSACGGSTPVCNTTSGTCVGCNSSADCGGATPVCNAGTRVCESCDADTDCGGQSPACQPSGACGECSPSNTSACGGATPVCNTTSGTCVGCNSSTDCSGATPVCNTASGTCVGCNSSADCGGATPVCNAGTRVCEACDADTDCGGQSPACQPSGACGECSASNASACSGATPVCNTTSGTCVGCNSSADCSGGAPVCDPANRTCVGCLSSADCGPLAPTCDPAAQACVCTAAGSETCNGRDDDCDGTVDEGCGDTDGDGLSDAEEAAIGTDPLDADSDDDGVRDGDEPSPGIDSDGDGSVDALDPDSDDDGLFDGTELGKDCSDPATDAALGRCVADADQGATRTDPRDPDTDDGGVSDGSEDRDLDGAIDSGETDPNDPSDDRTVADRDGDGLSDATEATLGTDADDADTDDDGLIDGEEPNPADDGDGDGLINALDPDSDDDGLFDGTEAGKSCDSPATDQVRGRCIADADQGATTTSPVDADTDDGGVRDGAEDANRNGVVETGELDPNDPTDDSTRLDTDGDGLSDALEQTLGSDPEDADSDDDGLRDGDESNPGDDADGDGKNNVTDADSDGDGLFDGTEAGKDCSDPATAPASPSCIADGDRGATVTSPVDPDTDRGGVRDGVEDTNRNGVVDSGETDPLDPSDDRPVTVDAGAGDAGAGDAGAGDSGAGDSGAADSGVA
ncbi:MAG: DUF11 domain-containing protein, partial [Deltaproteobacteria bacterium]|nr:DUF11 domain-containing protein [Deltaproteobacteria bacterium]